VKNSGTYELVCVFYGYEDISCIAAIGEDGVCLEKMVFS